ncbi:class I SAM-dependent methyltransferase [Streptomyces gobitricini]|uniref:Class I SAM-dependent methyltransferase n=1 Tax=Streptomyces gobitricini TaxID=68211 RepID=A0ABP5YLU5_9ACTN
MPGGHPPRPRDPAGRPDRPAPGDRPPGSPRSDRARADRARSDRARAEAAAAVYTPAVLKLYDAAVLGAVCSLVWRCPRREMLSLYERNLSARHLEVGPGTGYFLDRSPAPVPEPRLTLLDLNPQVLATARRRLARYSPAVRCGNVLEPLELDGGPFSSVALNFVLHCLPCPATEKGAVFDHLLPHMAPGARVFGSTVLAHGVHHTPLSRHHLRTLARHGVLHAGDDSLELLRAALESRFDHCRIRTRGAVALFEATGRPRRRRG